MQWLAQAPANIALIKYMGKKDSTTNLPDNPSLSYTLNNLQTNVMLESIAGKKDCWQPLIIPGKADFSLSSAAQARYLNHLMVIKNFFSYEGAFLVKSSNNFPQGTGLASSASSFAALTRCAVRAITELKQLEPLSDYDQAELSRLGSGSSCRSFFSPWAIWDERGARLINLPAYPELHHQVVVISHEEKTVSSSEAHRRVLTSPLYPTRAQRATHNLEALLHALNDQNWKQAYQITWQEFHDMHQLFKTAAHPFSYIKAESKTLLGIIQNFWHENQDGPLVTMDAGPNIHLLYRPDQGELAQQFKQSYLVGNYDVL